MADLPPSKDGPAAAPKANGVPKAEGNPAFRALGLPRISRWKLPSRNWLIFFGVTGSWATALLYDRYHKRRVQKKWCHFVSHLAKESLPSNKMPRKITILLAGPPGDGLRPAREHFHEYIKPILVAGAIDWEVIEGRREGEVRAGLAEKIRKQRRRSGERIAGDDDEEKEEPNLVWETRSKLGVSEWNGVQGDLILGRHTWKEYIRGLHEGWLGPLKPPQPPEPPEKASEALAELSLNSMPNSTMESESPQADPPTDASIPTEAEKPAEKPSKPSIPPPYISTESYPAVVAPTTLPEALPPSLPLQLPRLLGLKHTPTRLYRFLTRRHLADETGAQVAALVFATHSRPYTSSTSFASTSDPDSPSSFNSANTSGGDGDGIVTTNETWEQEQILKDEEAGWHKSAWKQQPQQQEEEVPPPPQQQQEQSTEGEATAIKKKERVWIGTIVIDPRIGTRMRVFELEDGARSRAEEQFEEMEKGEPSIWAMVGKYVGWDRKREKKGWEMGEEGDEDS